MKGFSHTFQKTSRVRLSTEFGRRASFIVDFQESFNVVDGNGEGDARRDPHGVDAHHLAVEID